MDVKAFLTRILAFYYAIKWVTSTELTYSSCSPYTFLPTYANNKTFEGLSRVRCVALLQIYNAVSFAYQAKSCYLTGIGLRFPPAEGAISAVTCLQQPPSDDLEEVAREKDTYASSPPNYTKDSAVDGNTSTIYVSYPEANPWWIVDLGAVRKIYKIMVRPIHNFFNHTEVRGGSDLETDLSDWSLMTYYEGPFTAEKLYLTLYVDGINARYISIQSVEGDSKWLVINEVEVMAMKFH